jgi:hypothetical protein
MNRIEREQIQNAEFFESAIVERSAGRTIYGGNLSAEFSRAEIVYWAMVGVQIEYLNRDYVRELFSRYSGPIVSACQILKGRGQFPFPLPQDWPGLPVELSEGGISIGNDESPDRPKETEPQPDLWKTFQHLMLLSSENLLDDETHGFVHGISWTEASQWNALREGNHLDQYSFPSSSHSVESIQLGFAQVTRHWKDESLLLEELLQHKPRRSRDSSKSKKLPHGARDPHWATARRFSDACIYISRHRYNLSSREIVERYLSYAGSLLQQTKDGSAGWLDLRREAFDELRDFVTRGEASALTLDTPRLWAVFVQNEMPVQSDLAAQSGAFESQAHRRIVLADSEQSEKDKDDEGEYS